MRDNSVPADSGDVTALMEVGLARLELVWLLDVLGDILDKHL